MIIPLLKGLGVTLRHFFKKPITLRYPEQKWTPYPRFRGLHQLQRDESGKEKCVGCCLCAAVCPAEAIYIETEENEDHERYAKVYRIDMIRCIFCGFCVEACPTEALVMKENYELADYERSDFVYTKERLLVPKEC